MSNRLYTELTGHTNSIDLLTKADGDVLYTQLETPQKHGAVGDGVTDDYVALQAWLDVGGMLYLPPTTTSRWYRSSAKLIMRRANTVIFGASVGQDPINAPANGYQYLPGSRIVFDAGVGGLDIQPSTTMLIPNDFIAAGAAGITQQGAYNGVIRDIMLIGSGGGTTHDGSAAVGINCRTLIHCQNVGVAIFGGKGWDLQASTTGDGSDAYYGNLSNSSLIDCSAQACGSHGLHIRGTDANTCTVGNFNSYSNGGVGIFDEALGQNLYLKPHIYSLGAAIKMIGNQSNVIDTPWVEAGTWQIGNGCVIIGADATSLYDPTYQPTTVHGARVRSKLVEAWGQNVALTINSTNSNVAKASLQDNGTIRGYFGASASYAFSVYNSGVGFAAGVPLGSTDWQVGRSLIVPETAAASIPTPAAGTQALFIDTADHKLKRKDSAAVVTIIA